MVSLKTLVYKTQLALESATENNELSEGLIKECNKDLKNLHATLKVATNRSMKSSVANIISLLSGLRMKMKLLRFKVGSGYKEMNPTRIRWIDVKSAFESRIRTGVIVNLTYKDPKTFLQDSYKLFHRRINNLLKKESALKINAVFCGEFKIMKQDKELVELKYLNTKNDIIYGDTDLKQWFEENIVEKILRNLDEFQERDSGWALSSVINLTININKYSPQIGSSFIELPRQIEIKKACVNVRNYDNKCFKWAVLSALHPADKDANRVQKYHHYSAELNFTGIHFPTTIKQIPR